VACGAWFGDLEPAHFHTACPHCEGAGCERCGGTGLHPEAAAVRWQGLRLPDLLARSVDEVRALLAQADLPSTAARLRSEIERRLDVHNPCDQVSDLLLGLLPIQISGRHDEGNRLAVPGEGETDLWLGYSDDERRGCLEQVLIINPSNESALRGLESAQGVRRDVKEGGGVCLAASIGVQYWPVVGEFAL
jgi:hypothetical protein